MVKADVDQGLRRGSPGGSACRRAGFIDRFDVDQEHVAPVAIWLRRVR